MKKTSIILFFSYMFLYFLSFMGCVPSEQVPARELNVENEIAHNNQLITGNQSVESRVRNALVLGNADYPSAPLKNPVNDANDIAAMLEGLGFQVTLLTNASQRQMEDAVREFGHKLRYGGVGLFYYAGHGLQVAGENYLVPNDAIIEKESDVKYECLDANRVLEEMDEARNGLNIMILDACRNNPFARSFRSARNGLAQMDAPTGTFIAFATAPGSVAEDGNGRNGVFTGALLNHMATPRLEIEKIMKLTRNDVLSQTNNEQVPWQSSSLTGDFYFVPGVPTASIPQSPTNPGNVPDLDSVIDLRKEKKKEWSDWQSRMELDFKKMERYDHNENLMPEEKADAWNIFLSAFSEENPYSIRDNELRKKANGRRVYWRAKINKTTATKSNKKKTQRFSVQKNGIIYDTSTGLEWFVGPKERFSLGWETVWKWIAELEVDGGRWRMPSNKDLDTIHDIGVKPHNVAAVFELSHPCVYSSDKNERGYYFEPHSPSYKPWSGYKRTRFQPYGECKPGFGSAAVLAVRSRDPNVDKKNAETRIAYDSDSGLEWYIGPDKNTNLNEARKWVNELDIDGGGWRMPTKEELKTLYKGRQSADFIDPSIKAMTTGWRVWADDSIFWGKDGYYYNLKYDSFTEAYAWENRYIRAFAVR